MIYVYIWYKYVCIWVVYKCILATTTTTAHIHMLINLEFDFGIIFSVFSVSNNTQNALATVRLYTNTHK